MFWNFSPNSFHKSFNFNFKSFNKPSTSALLKWFLIFVFWNNIFCVSLTVFWLSIFFSKIRSFGMILLSSMCTFSTFFYFLCSNIHYTGTILRLTPLWVINIISKISPIFIYSCSSINYSDSYSSRIIYSISIISLGNLKWSSSIT